MSNDPLDLDAIGQAALVAAKKISPRELVDAAIARIEAGDTAINAVTQRLFDDARATAESDRHHGPFRGVPFLVKDFYCHMAGTATTGSSRLLKDNVIDHDSELMRRYRAAGLITVGKTNTPELVSMGTTEPSWRGATHNPWNLDHTPGGSSGGAAAAVAAGFVAMAHANDGAGSTRIPAACCGLFGLKPSRGRITLGPDVGESIGGITAEHVVTRSVRDSAALLDATSGGLPGDPYVAEPPRQGFLAATRQPPKRLRIAVSETPLYAAEMDAECVAAVRRIAKLCADLGHDVVDARPKVDGDAFRSAVETFWPMTVTRALSVLAVQRNCTAASLAAELEPFNQYLFEQGSRRSAIQYLADLSFFQGVTRTFGRFFTDHDVWLTPTLAFVPPRLGYFDAARLGGAEAYRRVIDSFAFTVPANVAGLPSTSLPLATSASGLPIGIQITGRLNDEETLFALSAQLEQAAPWTGLAPRAAA